MMENPAFKSLKTAPGAVLRAFYTVLLTIIVSSGIAWGANDKPETNQCQSILKTQTGSELGDSTAAQTTTTRQESPAKARGDGLSVNFLKRITDRDGEWTAVVLLTENGFSVQEASDWENAERILEAAPLKYRKAFETLMMETSASFQVLLKHYTPLAKDIHAHFEARVKHGASLLDKIFNRARGLSEEGRALQPTQIKDYIGFRFVVPVSSPMLHYVYSKSTWGAILQIDPSYINEITLKGGPVDSEKGDYYRAIHLHLVTKSGLPYEIQVQSKGMAYWHKWDHRTVFKGPYAKGSPAREQLKQYSNAWARVIRWLEAATTNGETRWNSLTTIMNDYGVKIDIKDIHWLSDLDNQLSAKYNVPKHHGFFYDEPKSTIHERRDAYMYIFKLWTHLNDEPKPPIHRRERR